MQINDFLININNVQCRVNKTSKEQSGGQLTRSKWHDIGFDLESGPAPLASRRPAVDNNTIGQSLRTQPMDGTRAERSLPVPEWHISSVRTRNWRSKKLTGPTATDLFLEERPDEMESSQGGGALA